MSPVGVRGKKVYLSASLRRESFFASILGTAERFLSRRASLSCGR